MPEDQMDFEEFLGKLNELKRKLPHEDYKAIEAQLPSGLIQRDEIKPPTIHLR